MQIKVEKFTLQRNGKKYPAGSIVELPEAEAQYLVKSAPREFSIVTQAVPVENKAAAGDNLEDMGINQLRAIAAERNIATDKNFKKQDYIEAIRGADEADDNAELPSADLTGTVK